jgi:hypothetical protein
MNEEVPLDGIVIGGNDAGVAAALHLLRARRSVPHDRPHAAGDKPTGSRLPNSGNNPLRVRIWITLAMDEPIKGQKS